MKELNELTQKLIHAIANVAGDRVKEVTKDQILAVVQQWWEKIDLDHTHIKDLTETIDDRIDAKVRDDIDKDTVSDLERDVQELEESHERMDTRLDLVEDWVKKLEKSIQGIRTVMFATSETIRKELNQL